jgi:predicted phosphohydrolase
LEFQDNKKFLTDNPIDVAGEVLLLPGDIVPFSLIDRQKEFFDFISDHFEITYWLPGNHEYYHGDLKD